jgi:hypothetical protein
MISWVMVWFVLLGSSLVDSVCGMQQVEAYGHGSWFGYRWNAYERWSVLATCVTPVSL